MNVLLVGSGGREHALAWKLSGSPALTRLVCAPGNVGIARLCETRSVKADDVAGLVALAVEIAADLVVAGPEIALAAGLADRLAEAGIACFGPTAAAARLETSKSFTREFAERHALPGTPPETCEAVSAATAALARFTPPWVIKADGLAAGKGVVIAPDVETARAAVADMLAVPGGRVVIEQFMEGEELSFFALCDGVRAVPFGAAQDHKRAFDGDAGPNPGGMGAYAPAPVGSPELLAAAFERIVIPTVAGMAAEGSPYRGVLYAGLMATPDGPRLVEFNARFGDPECQVLMLRLESDRLPLLHAAAVGDLSAVEAPRWRDEAVVCVVLAAHGYPSAPVSGGRIEGALADFGPDVQVFVAGAQAADGDALIATGGRVLNVCSRGPNIATARARAYAAIDRIDFPQGFHRRDIAWRALGERATVA
ncbi:phosphoribosylamine--glycine ligase [soil metagenome]